MMSVTVEMKKLPRTYVNYIAIMKSITMCVIKR